MKEVQDNFSAGAAGYAAFRPASPDEVFDFLYAHVRHFGTAWDCGTGNGQVAGRLADRFEQVIATDISSDQLKLAIQKDNISYRQERAEVTGIESASIDLITVAQAIHWFDFEHFYAEVRRVARPGALCAAWTYNLLKLTPEVNSVIDDFYQGTTRKYWDKERDLVDAGYLDRLREGRRNTYRVKANRPLRHPVERGYNVGAILEVLHDQNGAGPGA